jgi:hypothetical protein
MLITAIARQAQGIRAGEVIAKLAEDAYFMQIVLTPKFGKESDLWVQLDEESV